MRRGIIVAAAAAAAVLAEAPGHAQFGPGFGFGQSEQRLVARFDKDGNGRLDREERQAARAAVGAGPRRGPRGGAVATSTPGPRLTPADVRPYPSTPLYDLRTLRTIFLDFEDADWQDELAAFYNTDVEVPATMVVDGRTYREVGVHFRGQSSYRMVPAGYKRSLNVSIDFVHKDQQLRSYRTLNLLNANGDPTFMRTVLFSEIARHYIPVPRANFVRVVIGGESWGIFVNVQQYNRDFVRDWFKTTGGARWKVPGSPRGRAGLEYLGEAAAAYKRLYEIRTRDDAEQWAALARLTKVLNETPPERLEAALDPILDVDGVLRFLAVDAALVNSDGYWTRASDYSIYRSPGGRFHIFPHDFNEALGAGGFGGFGGRQGGPELDPLVGLDDPAKPLRSKLLAVPALRQRYLGYIRDIAATWLDWDRIGPIVQASHALIAADVRVDTRKLYDVAGFEAVVSPTNNPLRGFFDRRRAYLLEYTAGAAPRTVAAR